MELIPENQQNGDNRKELAQERTLLAAERNELAAERTLSAWIRTGLAGVGGGLAILKFLSYQHEQKAILAKVVGILLICWGLLVFLYGLTSYYKNIIKIRIYFQTKKSFIHVSILTAIIFILSILVLVLVLE